MAPPNSPGATFVRADLHVHTYADTNEKPEPALERYIDAALESGIEILGITDHNTTRFTRAAMEAGERKGIAVVPGIEISTRDGHLLALFDPQQFSALESFASVENLRLQPVADNGLRSERSLLELVNEINERGGLAIPAHVDLVNGICDRLRPSELSDLLANPALAGLEFAKRESLEIWFTERDNDAARLDAWKARQRNPLLKDRGLARLMSSDAHSPEQVGQDRASRTLTRLRLDDANFAALRNAIQFNPKARCKAEAILPAAYPRIVRAEFEGGFLDGVTMAFTGNLNCLIGGRGSGKSTALLSIRAALGADTVPGEDPDEAERMPQRTTVTFIDNTGSERVAIRERGGEPVAVDGSPIRLRLADLGQDESGRLARGYKDEPKELLRFLDGFIVRHEFEEKEEALLGQLDENGAEVVRTASSATRIQELEKEQARLEGNLKAAGESKVEEIAGWAAMLATEKPLLEQIEMRISAALTTSTAEPLLNLDALAADYRVDLSKGLAGEFVAGDEGLRAKLAEFESQRAAIVTKGATELATAAIQVRASIEAWKEKQTEYEGRLAHKRKQLEEQGLEVQAGAVFKVANRLNDVKKQLVTLREKEKDHKAARKERQELVAGLEANRERLHATRKVKIGDIVDAANSYSDELQISVYFERRGINVRWTDWLTANFGFKKPRVSRIAALISPQEFAKALVENPQQLIGLRDEGSQCFDQESIKAAQKWPKIFELETMLLEDRPRIEVQRSSGSNRRSFDQLSAGQQRSVLLSLLLCADRSEPLILDQPEDHLDGRYIASAVVRHLEAAKERRQVLIATHSANLVVLGDSELVLPMRVSDGSGEPYAVGAVDREETRQQVCALLEGGTQAFKKRGQRYGFVFKSGPEENESDP